MIRNPVFDVESNGLLNTREGKAVATKIHVISIKDLHTGERYTYDPTQGSLTEALAIISNADRCYGHNIIKYDLPLLEMLFPSWERPKHYTDSMVAGRVVYAHVKELDWALVKSGRMPASYVGKHHLDAWGCRLGLRKGTYETDWVEWDEDMTAYCELDVDVVVMILQKLLRGGFSKSALDMEMQLARIMAAQESFGVGLDRDKAVEFYAELSAERQEVSEKLTAMFDPWYVGGKVLTPKRDNKRYGYVEGCPLQHIKLVHFNPGSRDHIAFRLKALYGWEAPEQTDGGRSKIDEAALEGCEFPEAEQLRRYLKLDKMIGQLAEGPKAWLKFLTDEDRIHGNVNTNGTRTHRATHSYPNLGQVPSIDKDPEFGNPSRDLFIVGKPGYKIMGSDAMGLELRTLAHHLHRWDDGAFGRYLLTSDVHTMLGEAWTIIKTTKKKDPDEFRTQRGKAKTQTYRYLYGGGNEALGRNVDPTLSEEGHQRLGKKLRDNLERKIAALGFLQKWVRKQIKSKGLIIGIDGRKVHSKAEYSALNTLLQTDGSLIVKYWIVEVERLFVQEFGPYGDPWFPMLWVHDEIQWAVREELVERARPLFGQAMDTVTSMFNLKCPMGADVKVGDSWKDTH